jgi:hypothetical protein
MHDEDELQRDEEQEHPDSRVGGHVDWFRRFEAVEVMDSSGMVVVVVIL